MEKKYPFDYVLRRYDKIATLPFMLVAYNETVTSIPYEMDGVSACTAFIKHKTTVDRYTKLGWIDETAAMKKCFDKKTKPNVSVENKSVEKEKKDGTIEFSSPAKPKRRTKK